ncbi:hypothetical protein LFWB_4640 [Candidatus Phytoplasma luffae]|uniref:Phage-associated protein n=1 Tax=Loofah witches'-broom phytoplasma TaxID=35773 RepID=A0A975FIE9_LOWBP|nr:type II toxin-antitoxin system antitoxin SocA domain-containing protein [Candidatus Phytoplasma luffae]QTX02607.1 phage-associated protein [Candidatus Phytoplasma luffae]QTX03030.1 hypothetical protein LFWB_4640 [Candidatus Phytoplasma luffae]
MKNNNQINVFDIANYLISQTDTNKYKISNMKINKLLYYIQGHYIAQTGKTLFPEKIEAWLFGPVILNIYSEFFNFVDNPIPNDYVCKGASKNELTTEAKEIIEKVINKYSSFSARELSVKTHEEVPWKEAYNPRKKWQNNIITHQLLEKFFKDNII